MQSESINELATALAKAQGEFRPIKKDKTATIKSASASYGYQYADLASVIESVRPVLSKHGLALTQIIETTPEGLRLDTRLLHSSGQWLAASYPLPNGGRAQEMGSAQTYARRYSLCALLGIAAEDDDDGASAAETKPRGNGRRDPSPPPAAKAPPVPAEQGPGFQLAAPGSGEQPMVYERPSQFITALGRAMQGADDPEAWWALNGPLARDIASKFPQAKADVEKLAEMGDYGRNAAA